MNLKKKKENKAYMHIEKILKPKHELSSRLLKKLEPSDIEYLRKLAVGTIPSINRTSALRALALLDDEYAGKIFSEILCNEEEKKDIRINTAINLALIPSEIAEPLLIKNLKIKDEIIKLKIIKVLGEIGGTQSLSVLDKIEIKKSNIFEKQLSLSKALISSRLGLNRRDLKFIRSLKREITRDFLPFTVVKLPSKELVNQLKLLKEKTFGVTISMVIGYETKFDNTSSLVLLNNLNFEHELKELYLKRNMVLGFIAPWVEEPEAYTIQYIIMTQTANSKIEIMVLKRNGEVVYSGIGNIIKNKLIFDVYDIKQPGSRHTHIHGVLDQQGLIFDGKFSKNVSMKSLSPKKLTQKDILPIHKEKK